MFKLYFFNELDSTNIKARDYKENSIIVAELQTKGRGKFDRKWASNFGGLYFSIVLGPNKVKNPAELTFLAALCVKKTLDGFVDSKIKWPNDVYVRDKKICGILTEGIYNPNLSKLIVGVGLNTNNELPQELSSKATSLSKIICEKVNNNNLLYKFIKNFEHFYKLYIGRGFSKILELWKENSNTINRYIKIVSIDNVFVGRVIDVALDCSLQLKLKN